MRLRNDQLAGQLVLLALASEFLLGGNVLEAIGIPYGDEGGPLIAKLNPGTYFAAAAMCAFICATGSPLRAMWRLICREQLLATYLGALVFCMCYACCMTGPGSIATFIDTFLASGMLACAMAGLRPRQADHILAALRALLLINATLALIEATCGARLVPVSLLATDGTEFRPTAFYDHPLTGATATMLGLFLAPDDPKWARHLYQLTMFAALLAFGGRTALFVSIFAAAAMAAYALLQKAKRRRLGPGSVAPIAVLLVAGAPVAVGILASGLANRLATHLYWDGSAQARIGQWDVLGLLNQEQTLFGARREDLIALIEPLRLKNGIDVIENFWLLMFVTLGILCFPVFVAAFFAFLRWIWQRGDVTGRVMVACLVLVASTSNSLGRKSTLLVMLVGCVLARARASCADVVLAPAALSAATGSRL